MDPQQSATGAESADLSWWSTELGDGYSPLERYTGAVADALRFAEQPPYGDLALNADRAAAIAARAFLTALTNDMSSEYGVRRAPNWSPTNFYGHERIARHEAATLGQSLEARYVTVWRPAPHDTAI